MKGIFAKYGIYNVHENIGRAVPSVQNANDVNVMAVSTYVHRGDELICDVNEEIGHHRLIEPLLYAMSCWGILPFKDEAFDYISAGRMANSNAFGKKQDEEQDKKKYRWPFGRK